VFKKLGVFILIAIISVPVLLLSGCSNNNNTRLRAGTFNIDISHEAREGARVIWEAMSDVVDELKPVGEWSTIERVELLHELIIEVAEGILSDLREHDSNVNVAQRLASLSSEISAVNSPTATRNIFMPWAIDIFYQIDESVLEEMDPLAPTIVYENGRITLNNIRTFWTIGLPVNDDADSLSLPFTLGANGVLEFTPHNRNMLNDYFDFLKYLNEDVLEDFGVEDLEIEVTVTMRFREGAFYINLVVESEAVIDGEEQSDRFETSMRFVR